MAQTTIRSAQILDTTVGRDDLNTATSGQAVVVKIIAGTNITLGSTGANAGTGDVTINASGGGSGITRSINSISGTTTGAAAASTDYVYLCTGTFTYTQPTAVSNTNNYTIKNVSTGIITIVFTSAQNADSLTSITLTQNQSLDMISDNANWRIN